MTDVIEQPAETPNTPSSSEAAPAVAATPATPAEQPAAEPAVDWRREIAGDDEKILAHLGRYNSQKDAIKAGFELKQKVSSGEYKRNIAFPKDGSAEDQIKWRAENGIPDSPDKYKMPDGLVIGEADKPVVDEFLKAMHAENAPEGAVKQAVDWYYKTQEQAAARAAEETKAQRVLIEETLRGEWGPEYLANKNMTENFVKTRFGDVVGAALLESSPEVVKELAAIAREINPAATVVPNSSNPAQSISDEIETLKAKMKNLDSWAKDTKGQARMVELLDAQERMRR
jgi:hypothetical protein